MNTSQNLIIKNKSDLKITIIGAGIAGSTTALHLAELGHKVSIIDPQPHSIIKRSSILNGSQASLSIVAVGS